jgi:hypothetical protein
MVVACHRALLFVLCAIIAVACLLISPRLGSVFFWAVLLLCLPCLLIWFSLILVNPRFSFTGSFAGLNRLAWLNSFGMLLWALVHWYPWYQWGGAETADADSLCYSYIWWSVAWLLAYFLGSGLFLCWVLPFLSLAGLYDFTCLYTGTTSWLVCALVPPISDTVVCA